MIPAQACRTGPIASAGSRESGADEVGSTVPKHLRPPQGEPDEQAAQILRLMETYLRDTSRDPVDTVLGLRHMYHHAGLWWEESIRRARRRGRTWREIREPSGDGISTVQDRATQRVPKKTTRKGKT